MLGGLPKDARMKPIVAISLHLIPAGALALALGEMPRDFYMLIHVVVFGASLLIAALIFNQDKNFDIWIGLFLLVAIIFNPIVPLHLTGRIWAILDIAAAVLFVGHYLNIRKNSKEKAGRGNPHNDRSAENTFGSQSAKNTGPLTAFCSSVSKSQVHDAMDKASIDDDCRGKYLFYSFVWQRRIFGTLTLSLFGLIDLVEPTRM
jgi:hypothetical protein